MSAHDQTLLAGYVLGAVSPEEAHDVEQHLTACSGCQECVAELSDAHEFLGQVPAEALLDGPIEDDDLLLGRILRAAGRQDKPASRRLRRASAKRWHGALIAAAAAVVAAGVFGGGIIAGRQSPPTVVATAAPSMSPGTDQISAYDTTTGVSMSVELTRATGWVALQATFRGVTPGSPCLIELVTRSGQRLLAGGWVAPPDARTARVTISGSAVVPPADLFSIEVDTVGGQRLVSAPL